MHGDLEGMQERALSIINSQELEQASSCMRGPHAYLIGSGDLDGMQERPIRIINSYELESMSSCRRGPHAYLISSAW